MTANLRRAAGSLMVVGLAGAGVTGLERAWLKLIRPAGIILFRRNIGDAQQTRALLAEAMTHCSPHSLRCVDVEGGSVNRLRDALAPIPSPQAVARRALDPILSSSLKQTRKDGVLTGKALMRQHGELIARAVKAFGFNVTLAPVLDLALPASAQVMGARAAAPTAAGIAEYARNFLSGLATHGIAGCGKHFPGLGGGTLDSHVATPTIGRDFRELWNDDLAPYRDLRDSLPMVMVNHASYPGTPGRNRPASVSSFWIGEVLGKRIGYGGIVLSDDLEMGGILKFMPMEGAAVESIRAGMDLIEICHSPELILRAYESLVHEAESSRAFRDLLLSRARQAEKKRMKLIPSGRPVALSPARLQGLGDRILRFGEAIGDPPASATGNSSNAETA